MQFSSVFTEEPDNDIPSVLPYTDQSICDICISVDTVKQLNVKKSMGPGGLQPVLLKERADYIAPSLTKLFNMTLKHGILPKDWKLGNIIPIFKKGVAKIAENYRPINLTSTICKMMEQLFR